jgi:eukaryotic-like serine/threonine-protein kinase
MPQHASVLPHDATTRSLKTASASQAPRGQLLSAGQIVASPGTKLSYRVIRLLGQGGYGQVYLVKRLSRSAVVPAVLCLKISLHIDGWLREAYFGQVLHEHPKAIRVFDRFPILQPPGPLMYCLAIEYARHGDLSAFLLRSNKRWPETSARREIAGILQVLGRLHRGQVLHRDLTPVNVFVCDGRHLKLGDFGIVRHQQNRRGITAHTLNTSMVPSDMLEGLAPKWRARDDVYQVGQLLAMLVKGDARARVRTREVRGLACSDELKEIIFRCIGERRKRYESADELIAALNHPPARLHPGRLRSLKGVHVAFTGILSKTRPEAMRAARRAGAIVHSGPSVKTSVLVRGRPNPLQAAGREGGVKLMEIKRLREKGHRITVLNEKMFWRLAGNRPRRRRGRAV